MPAAPSQTLPLLVLDTGSPLVSVAVGRDGEVLAARSVEIGRSSRQLLTLVDEALTEAGVRPGDLGGIGGIVALRGPGSFTGLRIGLATALGLHQALEVPATAIPTLQVLAASVPAGSGTVIAVVDALRGDWSAQAFTAEPFPRALTRMELVAGGDLPRLAGEGPAVPVVVIGFGAARLGELPGWPAEIPLHEPGPLAPVAVRLLALGEIEWEPGLLTDPVYSRPPAVTLPKRRAIPAPSSSII